ncbi:MAG: DbpA RNA binding domain-containing protein, partial [Bacteroidota bacterium]|nr:DbpA RNA binding domain-containing protein [Bacteroidota bacterium]
EKVENVEVEENQIAEFLPVIFNKLAWLDREELIKRFVSVEFNRFLAYYKDATDINVDHSSKSRSASRDDRPRDRDRDSRGREDRGRDGRGRDDRPRSDRSREDKPRSERSRDDRPREDRKKPEFESRDRNRDDRKPEFEKKDFKKRRDDFDTPEPARRGADRPKVKFAPMVLNVGSNNNFNPKALLSLINQYMPDQEAQIGKIDVQFTHTLFDVDEAYQDQVMNAFKKAKFKGNNLVVDQVRKKRKE